MGQLIINPEPQPKAELPPPHVCDTPEITDDIHQHAIWQCDCHKYWEVTLKMSNEGWLKTWEWIPTGVAHVIISALQLREMQRKQQEQKS